MKDLGIGPNLAFLLLGIVLVITFGIAVMMAKRGTVKKRRSRGQSHVIDMFDREKADEEPPAGDR